MTSVTGSVRALGLALGAALLLVAACATQREQRLSSAEARERPTDEPCDQSRARGKQPSPRHEWACGYWHWDSVRYVWVDGHWEAPR